MISPPLTTATLKLGMPFFVRSSAAILSIWLQTSSANTRPTVEIAKTATNPSQVDFDARRRKRLSLIVRIRLFMAVGPHPGHGRDRRISAYVVSESADEWMLCNDGYRVCRDERRRRLYQRNCGN